MALSERKYTEEELAYLYRGFKEFNFDHLSISDASTAFVFSTSKGEVKKITITFRDLLDIVKDLLVQEENRLNSAWYTDIIESYILTTGNNPHA